LLRGVLALRLLRCLLLNWLLFFFPIALLGHVYWTPFRISIGGVLAVNGLFSLP
jgi:hypothetical protein